MICPACNHKHYAWNSIKFKFEYIDTEKFIKLPIEKLFACPKCGCVLIEV